MIIILSSHLHHHHFIFKFFIMVLLSGKHSADAIEDDIVATVDVLNHDLITLVEEELKVGHDVKDEQSYKILSIPGKGNGMIATRKLYPGEVIISETPLLVIPEKTFDNADKLESYLERQINKLSSEDRNKFFDLSDCRIVEKNAFDGYSYCGSCYTNAMTYGEDAAICPTNTVTVDFALEPVMPATGTCASRMNRSISPSTVTPASRASRTTGISRASPGLTINSDAVRISSDG